MDNQELIIRLGKAYAFFRRIGFHALAELAWVAVFDLAGCAEKPSEVMEIERNEAEGQSPPFNHFAVIKVGDMRLRAYMPHLNDGIITKVYGACRVVAARPEDQGSYPSEVFRLDEEVRGALFRAALSLYEVFDKREARKILFGTFLFEDWERAKLFAYYANAVLGPHEIEEGEVVAEDDSRHVVWRVVPWWMKR